ncbi:MAG: ATP-dependent DNA helicase RecG [Candidatus Midichloria mitochondrii]|nr:ATP-dependent DNA helicase RecG [Candidatus Midichloria mitochondrii]
MNNSVFFINRVFNNPLQYIKGVGPKKAELLSDLGYNSVRELIFRVPTHYIDRRKITALDQAESGQILSQIVTIEVMLPKNRGQKITKILCQNQTGSITLIFFHINKSALSSWKVGDKIAISGKVDWNYGNLQMLHPDIMVPASKAEQSFTIEPVYPASLRLSSKSIASVIKEILKVLPLLPEWIPLDLKEKLQLPSWNEAINIIHNPKNDAEIKMIDKALERLAFDEILTEQIMLEIAQSKLLEHKKTPLTFTGLLQNSFLSSLPFKLTNNQKEVLEEINNDQKSDQHMVRILQGDVGSGKTIIAFLAAINVIEAGAQAIIMVPTELLARQHFSNFKKLFPNSQIESSPLISKIPNSQKKQLYDDIRNGKIKLIIGTHALIQSEVQFHKPGLIIIDEQHKFGVAQRLELLEKGVTCDFLMMSATPIPRTLIMMHYGSMKISTLKEKPAGRLQIITSLLSSKKSDFLIHSIKNAIEHGAKVYWICPLIEESENLSLNNVKQRYDSLEKIFGNQVAVIHSRVKVEEREKIMEDFASQSGNIKILVATTVIEVGVDVPDATIMVIEHAERFGLAQMHQLRGRVGRGNKQSHCILLYSHPLSVTAKYRLEAMKKTNDGSKLAEEDLRIRGSGKILGTQQSGLPLFKIYDFFTQQHLIRYANHIALEQSNNLDEKFSVLINLYSDTSLSSIAAISTA